MLFAVGGALNFGIGQVDAANRVPLELQDSTISFSGDESFIKGRYTWEPRNMGDVWKETINFSGGFLTYRELASNFYFGDINDPKRDLVRVFGKAKAVKKKGLSATESDVQKAANKYGDFHLLVKGNENGNCGIAKQFFGDGSTEGMISQGNKIWYMGLCWGPSKGNADDLKIHIISLADRVTFDNGAINERRAAGVNSAAVQQRPIDRNQNKPYFTHIDVRPIVVYEQAEVDRAISLIVRQNNNSGPKIEVEKYDLFKNSATAKSWLDESFNRAIAVGYPSHCSYRYRSWNFRSVESAVRRSLTKCLEYVSNLNSENSRDCGCTVAAINSNIFFTPEKLPFRSKIPAVIVFEENTELNEIYGHYVSEGRINGTFPMGFYNLAGKEICTGTYTTYSRHTGTIEMKCFDGQKSVTGEFEVIGGYKGRPVGTAKGETESGDRFYVVFGLPAEEFDRRRAEFIR